MTGGERSSRFTVGRASCAYVVPREHPAPEDVRRRADVVFRERVPPVCARALSLLVRDDDPSVWLIERLDIDVALGGALDEHLLAEAWSRAIARSLALQMSRGDGVVHFATRAAFIARYVIDAAAGRDAGKWYYAPFESLQALPAAQKVREAIVREPEQSFAIVTELVRANRLAEVLAVLGDRGSLAVWEAAFPSSGCDPSARVFELLLASWEGGDVATPRIALRLAASVLREMPDEPPPSIRAHVDALLVLAETMRANEDEWTLVEALLEGDLAAALRIVDRRIDSMAAIAPLQLLMRIAATRADLITCAASTVRTTAAPATVVASDAIVGSAFAGYALLLPFLPELDCAAREAVLAKCAGRDELRFDAIAKLLRGDEEERADELAQSDEELSAFAASVLTAFAACLPGFARSSAAHLRENFLDGHGALRITRDQIDVFLPRVPLTLLLRITGAHGKTFTLPWLPDRPVTLLLPEDV